MTDTNVCDLPAPNNWLPSVSITTLLLCEPMSDIADDFHVYKNETNLLTETCFVSKATSYGLFFSTDLWGCEQLLQKTCLKNSNRAIYFLRVVSNSHIYQSKILERDKQWFWINHWHGKAVISTAFMSLETWVTHICVGKLTAIGSDNGLAPGRRQAITWTNAGICLIGLLGTNFSEILIKMYTFSFKKMHLKMSGKWRSFCLGLNVIQISFSIHHLGEIFHFDSSFTEVCSHLFQLAIQHSINSLAPNLSKW